MELLTGQTEIFREKPTAVTPVSYTHLDVYKRQVLDVLQANGVNVQSPLSVIDEAQADMVRRAYAPKPEPKEEPKPAEAARCV